MIQTATRIIFSSICIAVGYLLAPFIAFFRACGFFTLMYSDKILSDAFPTKFALADTRVEGEVKPAESPCCKAKILFRKATREGEKDFFYCEHCSEKIDPKSFLKQQ